MHRCVQCVCVHGRMCLCTPHVGMCVMCSHSSLIQTFNDSHPRHLLVRCKLEQDCAIIGRALCAVRMNTHGKNAVCLCACVCVCVCAHTTRCVRACACVCEGSACLPVLCACLPACMQQAHMPVSCTPHVGMHGMCAHSSLIQTFNDSHPRHLLVRCEVEQNCAITGCALCAVCMNAHASMLRAHACACVWACTRANAWHVACVVLCCVCVRARARACACVRACVSLHSACGHVCDVCQQPHTNFQ